MIPPTLNSRRDTALNAVRICVLGLGANRTTFTAADIVENLKESRPDADRVRVATYVGLLRRHGLIRTVRRRGRLPILALTQSTQRRLQPPTPPQ